MAESTAKTTASTSFAESTISAASIPAASESTRFGYAYGLESRSPMMR